MENLSEYFNVNHIKNCVNQESKTPWLKKIFGLGKSKTIALRGLHILNDVHVKTTIVPRNLVRFSKSRDESTMIRFRNKDLSVFLVSLEELQIEEVVVWNPNRSLNPEDSFIGDIKQTAVHIDVTNVQTFYAELSMVIQISYIFMMSVFLIVSALYYSRQMGSNASLMETTAPDFRKAEL